MRRNVGTVMLVLAVAFAPACSSEPGDRTTSTRASESAGAAGVPATPAASQTTSTSSTVPVASVSAPPTTPSLIPQPLPAITPSQSPGDAQRDGVVPELAALPSSVRAQVLVQVDVEGGAWGLAVPSEELERASVESGCVLGDLMDGAYGVDFICTLEYGEILLLDAERNIARAYPMPGAVPSWLIVTDAVVYGGHIGDGALPDSTLVRIDRSTLAADVLLIPASPDGGSEWPPTWQIANTDQVATFGGVIRFGPDASGTEAASWIGDLSVDLKAIELLFSPSE